MLKSKCFLFGGYGGIRPSADGAVVGSDCHRQSFTTDPSNPSAKLYTKRKKTPKWVFFAFGGDGGIRTPGRFDPPTDFESASLRPLRYISILSCFGVSLDLGNDLSADSSLVTSCCGAQKLQLALASQFLTAATRSARFICRRQRSHRSPLRYISVLNYCLYRIPLNSLVCQQDC